MKEIRHLAQNKTHEFREIDLDETGLPFPKSFDGRSARARAYLLYLASLNPLSIHNVDNSLNLNKLFASMGSKALGYIHHNPSEADEFSSIPANRMFIDDDLSGDIFDHLVPLSNEFLIKFLPSQGFALESIEQSLHALRNNNRNEFIGIRQNDLIEGERQFIHKKGVCLPDMLTAETVADSDVSDIDDEET